MMIEVVTGILISCVGGFIVAIISLKWARRPVPHLLGLATAAVLLVIVYWLSTRPGPAVSVSITAPTNGTEVGLRQVVEGRVSDPSARIFVLIHPMPTDVFWVQNIPVVQNDGTWRAEAYFGTKDVGIGDSYEVVAIAAVESWPARWLKQSPLIGPGVTIKELPPNLSKSDLVIVRRSK